MSQELAETLATEYQRRFAEQAEYRTRVWRRLIDGFFADYTGPELTVLDLGCGWGEFINQIDAGKKFGMDLNPESRNKLSEDVEFLEQDCSENWEGVDANSLDLVFTSNFFEHLPNKEVLSRTLRQAFDALRPGGRLLCLGPNIRYLPGAYWDFYDHYLPLTDLSLAEGLELCGFEVEKRLPKFLPYTMALGTPPPEFFVSVYLKIPFVWPIFGKQFLLSAVKPA